MRRRSLLLAALAASSFSLSAVARAQAVPVAGAVDPMFLAQRDRLAAPAIKHALPMVAWTRLLLRADEVVE